MWYKHKVVCLLLQLSIYLFLQLIKSPLLSFISILLTYFTSIIYFIFITFTTKILLWNIQYDEILPFHFVNLTVVISVCEMLVPCFDKVMVSYSCYCRCHSPTVVTLDVFCSISSDFYVILCNTDILLLFSL